MHLYSDVCQYLNVIGQQIHTYPKYWHKLTPYDICPKISSQLRVDMSKTIFSEIQEK